MEIKTNSRIAKALNTISMISCIYVFKLILAQRGRIHLLLRDKEEEKTVKGLKKTINRDKDRFSTIEDKIIY